jgi:hypothetical protein
LRPSASTAGTTRSARSSRRVDAGLEIRSLREYPFCEWKLDFTEPSPDGSWRLPGDLDGRMPLFFSILATKRRS